MPIEIPSDGLDLLAMQEAGDAVEAAAARVRADAIRGRLAPSLSALPPPLRHAMEAMIEEVARASAEAEAARQAALEMRRERGEWLQIDPLRHIPEDRGAQPPAAPSAITIHAADPDFVGFGWHSAEGRGDQSWRWSGATPAASVVVPDLGPGTLRVELDLEFPFRQAITPGALTVLANGEPLELDVRLLEPHRGVFSALWAGYGVPGANLGLVLLGPRATDPTGRDPRELGLAFRSVSARRVASSAG
ncbi:hypothetical protein J8J14_04535 [Roseomonas sp. SSH11]|uniref:Uncharacterized protein n=1 Tax=Pararoseomonas baculiformis TaxID=2820812 RepID=A0ABS4AAL3_9PROT|nr:hypothetical protein [Pararoseomonas baculiformis]MBP0444037.1 hypothetical protein [Pararoseomonas baculiformis]